MLPSFTRYHLKFYFFGCIRQPAKPSVVRNGIQCNAAGDDTDESWEDYDDDNDKSTELILWKEIISLCERLEQACIQEADLTSSLELPRQLRKFWAQLQHLENGDLKQTRIEQFLV